MSNSSLVNYTRYSPNHSGTRNHSIDTITIHCVVGQCSVETLGSIFADSNREASSNYGVGYDGKIGLYVDEANRSWCSSSSANDNRAVTIEVASDTYHPYAVNDAAYNATIKLVADICKRNGIKKLVWSTDKNTRVNHLNGCNMTVHRDYANKSCPGDYLYNRMGEIASKVNSLLGTSGSSTSSSTSKPSSSSSTKATIPDVTYCVRTNGRWLPSVKNLTDYAGISGSAITDVAIKVSNGSVKYRVHTKGGRWLPYVTGYSTTDTNKYAGNGTEIDAVEVYYFTNQDLLNKGIVYKAKYRTSSVSSSGYYDWQYDDEKTNGQDGYAGAFGKLIDKLQIVIE